VHVRITSPGQCVSGSGIADQYNLLPALKGIIS
jgi:hypothetical protein